jgi:hypothetical protein
MRQIRSARVVPPQPRSRVVGGPCFSTTSRFAVGIASWSDQQAPRWLADRCAVVLPETDRVADVEVWREADLVAVSDRL